MMQLTTMLINICEVAFAISIIAFLVTSVLWFFFSKPFKKLHYFSLTAAAVSLVILAAFLMTTDTVSISYNHCRNLISDAKAVTTTLFTFAALYSFIGIIVAVVRKVLKLPTKILATVCVITFIPAVLGSYYLDKTSKQQKANCELNTLIPSAPSNR